MILNKPSLLQFAFVASAADAGAPEVKVVFTDEMINAGLSAYYRSSGDDEEMVKRVFRAMLRAKKGVSPKK